MTRYSKDQVVHLRTRPARMPIPILYNALKCCNNAMDYIIVVNCKHCEPSSGMDYKLQNFQYIYIL